MILAWLLLIRPALALAAALLVAALTMLVRRRRRPPAHPWVQAAEPLGRQAWAAAWLANARIAQLEQRLRELERDVHEHACEADRS